ncbi:MAG: hypothetical protein WBC85_09130 [Planktotalea sp.]|uniref:hypothetical protein n=1 Tax=Planktotalea sp. TaxID=2029877 RepID=UPI003C794FD6
MFKVLNFFKSKTGALQPMSQRSRFEAVQEELNAVLAELNDMPSVTIDPSARVIQIIAPEQFADEALALPAPETEPELEGAQATGS